MYTHIYTLHVPSLKLMIYDLAIDYQFDVLAHFILPLSEVLRLQLVFFWYQQVCSYKELPNQLEIWSV